MKSTVFSILLAKARRALGLTQEQACLEIGVADTSTLSKWETGKEIPSDRMVAKIVQTYEDPFLGYIYLYECTEIGRMILPPVERNDLGNSVLLLQKEHTDINRIKDSIIEIACDGKIDAHEQEQWDNVLKEVIELASACIGLSFIASKKPLQDGNLERAYIKKNILM